MALNWTINVGHATLNTNIKEKKEEHESYIITSKFDSPPKISNPQLVRRQKKILPSLQQNHS